MIFNIIQNRKGEKILSIQGFNPNEKDRLQEYGEEQESKEGEEDDQVLFINLNKLAANRNNLNDTLNIPNNIHTDVNDYLTENPYTKVLDQFPNRLTKEEIPNVIISDEIGSGSHARVYKGEFLDTPVAIKVYKNQNPLSLNAFISELEAYYIKPSQEYFGKVLSHPNIVSILAAYQHENKSFLVNELSDLGSMHQMK